MVASAHTGKFLIVAIRLFHKKRKVPDMSSHFVKCFTNFINPY